MNKNILLTPGPVSLKPETLSALAQPVIHHRTSEFESIMTRVLENLKKVVQTQGRVFVLTSTGSGAMEAALVNTLNVKDKVIGIVSGKFGERWIQMAQKLGFTPVAMNLEWGQAVKPEAVKELLGEHPDAKAVLCQACETSTGVAHPINMIASVVREHSQALFMVDAVSALGAYDIPTDQWQLDVLIAGSQKGLCAPTGLAVLALSERAWKQVETCQYPRYYWDLLQEHKANQKGATFFSSPTSLIRALDVVLMSLQGDGLRKAFQTVEKRARVTRRMGGVLGLELFPERPAPSLTVFKIPSGVSGESLQQELQEIYGVVAMGGQDHLKGKILRLGHMGAITDDELTDSLEKLGRALQKQNPQAFSEQKIKSALQAARDEVLR